MSNSSIMSIREMIDTAFGETDVNIVNFKLIQAVLYLLARQLRILERRVRVEIEINRGPSRTNLSVSEVKIHATVPKKRNVTKPTVSSVGVSGQSKIDKLSIKPGRSKATAINESMSEKSSEEALDKSKTSLSDKTKSSTDKTSTEKTKISSDKTSSDKTKTTSDMTSSDKTKTSTDITSSMTTSDKTSTDQTKDTSDMTSSDKTKTSTGITSTMSTSDKISSDKTKTSTDITSSMSTSDKTSSDKTKTSTDITSSEKTKTSSDKTTSEKTKTSSNMTSSDKTKTSTDITSSMSTSDKTSSDKTKTSTDITSSEKTKTSSDKTTSEKTKTSSGITSSDKTKTSTDITSSKSTSDKISSDKTKTSTDITSSMSTSDKTSSDKTKTSTDITSSQKTKSSSDKTSSEQTESTDKSSTDKTTSSSKKSSSTKDTSDRTTSDERKEKDLPCLLDLIEEQREKELRVVHQRADSREVRDGSPTPMASLDSVEEQYEKLLVVERVPVGARTSVGKRTSQLSIVTQDQFEALANIVRDLQGRLAPVGTPGFPENMQLMQELRKGASLTDAMAALQLSARLEAAEKTLQQMLQLVTDLAAGSGLDVNTKSARMPDNLHKTTEISSHESRKSVSSKRTKKTKSEIGMPVEVPPSSFDTVQVSMPSSEPSKVDVMPTPTSMPGTEEDKFVVPPDWVTYDDLDQAIQEVTDGLYKTINGLTTRSNAIAENAMKTAKNLGEKLESSLNMGSRMKDLELLVSDFSEQINILDTGLSSQMTNYQEELTQMQHDLEAGLESMAEALANTGGDTAAVAELNANFTNLQTDFDDANTRQRELKESQNELSVDLEALWKQIEVLRETKPDRDEVADALRDKAGIGELNGLVSLQQFNAVRGDFEKRIGAAYDKFNNQEITWQKALDDILREMNDKADWDQLVALRTDVNNNLEMLRKRINAMLAIVGEPRAAAISKQLFRDAACLSCSSPAHMDLEEINTIPELPAFPRTSTRPPTIGAEDSSKPAEFGDHKLCYPGLPIPHPRDPRSHICQRYCGGSHTLVTDKKGRTPVGINISPILRPFTTGVGSDGKTYVIEEGASHKKPCMPCNKEKNNPSPSEATEPAQIHVDLDSGMTPLDFMMPLNPMGGSKDGFATPPPPTEDF